MPVLNQAGQFATTAQARNFEEKHKRLFADLVSAWEKYHKAKQDLDSRGDASMFKRPLLNAHASKLIKLTAPWMKRQRKLDSIPGGNARAFEYPVSNVDWLNPVRFEYIKQIRDQMDQEKRPGVGFIPLIIWAVIAIVGAYTATEIVDEMNNTAEEQAQLTTTTNNFCTDNQLTSEQCTALLQQSTDAAGGDSGFPWIKILLFGGLGLFAYNKLIAPKNGKAA